MSKIKLTIDEQKNEISSELETLREMVGLYDKGSHRFASKIATSIDILMSEKRDVVTINSLGLSPLYLNLIPPLDAENLLPQHPAIGIQIKFSGQSVTTEYYSLISDGKSPEIFTWIDRASWWNQPVLGFPDNYVTRKDIVKNFRDQRGGAHIGPTITSFFDKLHRQGNGMEVSGLSGEPVEIKPSAADAMIRHIAIEAVETVTTALAKVTGA